MFGAEMVDVIRLSLLAIALSFIGYLMNKAGKDTEFKIISIIAFVFMLGVVANYVMDFFNVIETMLNF